MDQIYRYGDLLAWAPALALLLVTALVSFSRIFERNPATLGLLAAVVFWVWADVTHGFVSDPALKTLLFHLQFVFLSVIPVTWVETCFRLTGRRDRFRTAALVFLSLVSVGFTGLLAVDSQTHWVFSRLELPDGSWSFYRQNGPAYYVFVVVLFSSLIGGVVLLARSRRYYSILDHKRSTLILWGIGFPTTAGLIDVFRLWPDPAVTLVPWSLLLTAGFFLVAIARGRLFAPVPLAYEIVVQKMADPVVVMDNTQRPVWLNDAARALWPALSSDPDRRLAEVFADLSEHLGVLRGGGEVVVQRDERQFRVQGTPAQDQRSGFEALAFVFHDITGLKAEQNRLEALVDERTSLLHQVNQKLEEELERSQDAQGRLERLLAEKELLLQEVNHRVKNNLQIILSLINLQARRLAPGSAAAEVYAATQGRIRSISLVHDLIYRTQFADGLDLRTYLEELVKGIGALYAQQETHVEIRPGPATVPVGVDFSVDFGLVVNELVTNALKHGIVPAGGGTVTVGLETQPSLLLLTVHDTGGGFSADEPESTSLGLGIVRSVLKKYRATLGVSADEGTLVTVRFPWETL